MQWCEVSIKSRIHICGTANELILLLSRIARYLDGTYWVLEEDYEVDWCLNVECVDTLIADKIIAEVEKIRCGS